MPARLAATLEAALAAAPAGPLCVGYSGGLDSTALLHALSRLSAARARGLRALHVDHGLHPDSTAWAAQCRETAAALDVPIEVRRVNVEVERGQGLEAAAREARRGAFAASLAPGELLVLAHHRDDQAETVLLKLLRGAGPEGLGGMRVLREFGVGFLFRPLLELPRAALAAHAAAHGLRHLDDPSNADARHARNFLRHEVLPLLRTRWPQVDAALGHSARWLAQAAGHLDATAAVELARLRGLDPATLDWRGWLALPDALRANVLRAWLRDLDLSTPEIVHIAQLERQLAQAESDRLPCVAWHGAQIRRYREWIHALAPLAEPSADWRLDGWNGEPVTLPAGCGRIALAPIDDDGEAPADIALTLAFRRGGERLRPAGARHTRELRDLWQEAGIPPWRRGRVPLVWRGDTLLAVGDYWLAAEGSDWLAGKRLHIVWSGEHHDESRIRQLTAQGPKR